MSTTRTVRYLIVTGLVACGLCAVSVAASADQKATPTAFAGTWALDKAASVNPSGPQGAAGRARSSGGNAQSGADDSMGIRTGEVGGALGPQEKQRFYAMLRVLEQAPESLMIAATDKEVTLTFDGGKAFHHMTDGKKQDLPTGNKSYGDLEVKTKWDGANLKREIKTIDGLTVIETYTPSADGKQLIVTLDLKSQVERLADAQKVPIKRVYNRTQ
jgi:hypothetical protein